MKRIPLLAFAILSLFTISCSDSENSSELNSEPKASLKSKNKGDINSEEFKNFDTVFNDILKSQEKYKEMDQKTEILFPVSKKLLEKYGDPIKYNDTYSYKNDKELIVNKALNRYFELTNNN